MTCICAFPESNEYCGGGAAIVPDQQQECRCSKAKVPTYRTRRKRAALPSLRKKTKIMPMLAMGTRHIHGQHDHGAHACRDNCQALCLDDHASYYQNVSSGALPAATVGRPNQYRRAREWQYIPGSTRTRTCNRNSTGTSTSRSRSHRSSSRSNSSISIVA